MFPALMPRVVPDGFSRCEERRQIKDSGKNLDPMQKADAAVKDAVYHALWKDSVLRAIEYYEIDVYVKNGVVHLSGHIVSATSQTRIMNAIRTVPGILEIRNNLVLDDRLTLEVASSLGTLEHTYNCKFFTGVSHGVISLNGIVNNENIKFLAEKCAASNPNVRGVINHVTVKGSEQETQGQRCLQPTMEENIYFLNGISGVVKQVIINPNNRLVIAMVVQGKFTDWHYEINSPMDAKARIPERLVVIPMNVVRYLTKVSGFLHIDSTDRDRYQDFDPAFFSTPNPDWVAPYPYCPKDILFNIGVGTIEKQIMFDPDIVQLNISAQPTSPQKTATPVNVIASWEDDGGQIIQTAEVAG